MDRAYLLALLTGTLWGNNIEYSFWTIDYRWKE